MNRTRSGAPLAGPSATPRAADWRDARAWGQTRSVRAVSAHGPAGRNTGAELHWPPTLRPAERLLVWRKEADEAVARLRTRAQHAQGLVRSTQVTVPNAVSGSVCGRRAGVGDSGRQPGRT